MAKLNAQEIFDKLNATYHIAYEYELFTDPSFEYWNLSDILATVNNIDPNTYKNAYTLGQIFRDSIPPRTRAKNPDTVTKMVADNVRILDDGKNFDAELSRYACWALVRQIGDGAIFHQEYFMHPGDEFSNIRANALQSRRIPLRAFVTKYEKQLNGILGKLNHGTYQDNYSSLRREINARLFDDIPTHEIREYYHLGERRPLTDYMNAYLLDAYGNMLCDTVTTWDNIVWKKTYGNLCEIALKYASATRKKFVTKSPVQNFDPSSIDAVIKQRGMREAEFTKKFLHANSR